MSELHIVASFGQRLRQLRRSKGLDQRQLGFVIQCSDAAISMWENDKQRPQREYMERMSRFFGVTQHYLAYGYEDPMLARDRAA